MRPLPFCRVLVQSPVEHAQVITLLYSNLVLVSQGHVLVEVDL